MQAKIKKEVWQLAFIIIVGVALRLIPIAVFTNIYKPVDTFIVDQQSAKVILNMQNPYTHTYHVHSYTLGIYAYLPMVPIYYAALSFLGDFRFANILADTIIMLSAYWIAKSLNC